MFALNDVSDGHALRFVGYELLHRYDVINKFKVKGQVIISKLGLLLQVTLLIHSLTYLLTYLLTLLSASSKSNWGI